MTPRGPGSRRAALAQAHRATTAHLGSAYPFASDGGLGGRGVVIGQDLCGTPFAFDPFELYRQGVLSNPNMIVCGQIGRGKSALVKSYLWRQSLFGRRSWVIDPKGEYGTLAARWGVVPIRLAPGGPVRLNPLELPTATAGGEPGEASKGEAPGQASTPGAGAVGDPGRRRMELLGAIGSACLGRALTALERAAIEIALDEVAAVAGAPDGRGAPTLPRVIDALLSPAAASARALQTDVPTLAAGSRDLALELRRLVRGDLRGMFDGPTSEGISLDASLVVLDLSAVYGSDALGILMACATAWLEAARTRATRARGTIVVVDEAWAILSHISIARWLQSSWKLARAHGVVNVAVLHRLSDLRAAGAAGSEQEGLARGLLSDSETRVVYCQAPGEIEPARGTLGLTATESLLLPRLARGVALWKVGCRSFLVRHLLSPAERVLVDTDERMAGATR